MTAGIIIVGTDERRQVVRQRPLRAALIGELPTGYAEGDCVERALEERKLRNASALYLGVGRWGLWLYWRRRPALPVFFDAQAAHVRAEAVQS